MFFLHRNANCVHWDAADDCPVDADQSTSFAPRGRLRFTNFYLTLKMQFFAFFWEPLITSYPFRDQWVKWNLWCVLFLYATRLKISPNFYSLIWISNFLIIF